MRSLLLFLFLVFAAVTQAQAKTYNVGISADGKTYALVEDLEDQRIVVFYSVDDPNAKPVAVGLGDKKTGALHWGGPNHVMIELLDMRFRGPTLTGMTTIDFDRWVSVNSKNGKIEMLFGNLSGEDYLYYIADSGKLLSSLPEENEALFSRGSIKVTSGGPTRLKDGEDDLVYGLHRANVKTGRIKRQEWGKVESLQWLTDEAGNALARVDSNKERQEWRLHTPDGRSMKLKKTVDYTAGDIKEIVLLGRAPEAGYAVVRTKNSGGTWAYQQLNLSTGDIEEMDLGASGLFGVGEEIYDPRRARAHAVIQADGMRVYHFNEDDRAIQEKLGNSLPGASLLVESVSLNRERFIIKAMYTDKPDERYLFDEAAKRLELIARD